MSPRLNGLASLLLLSVLCLAFAACGSSAQGGATDGMTLHATLTKPRAAGPLINTDVRDSAAVARLYNAALALPAVPPNAIMHCPADDGARYHLTFSGGSVTVHEMEANASGCRSITLGAPEAGTHLMNDAFVARLVQTLGVSSLDPFFP